MMTPHVHDLAGCAPVPLAHYLKALGILRLVAEQADPEARGWWDGERFRLLTTFDRKGLERFFLEKYQPTPLVAPWNGGSGFFRTWDSKKKQLRNSKNEKALSELISQEGSRWQPFRDSYQNAIDAVGSVLKVVDVDILPDKERKKLLIVPKGKGPVLPVADKDKDKQILQRAMLHACAKNEFYRSVVVDMGDDFGYPSLWGSGGNDGAIDFTARYFENLLEALVEGDSRTTRGWLQAAFFAEPAQGMLTKAAGKVGQFLPSGAGGANSTVGPGSQNDTQLNPWDFILMLEGAVLFSASATRRLGVPHGSSRVAAPFTVGGQGAGYASAAGSDESARGEQWMPLWGQPMLLAELRHLLAEGRAQVGARAAKEPLDLARAVARLGVARGINAFQRYGYIERNGQSNLAVPLGRFVVPEQAVPQLTCLDDLDAWIPRLRRETSNRLKAVTHRLAEAMFAVIQHPQEAARWRDVLLALAGVDAVMVAGGGVKAGPIPKLRPEWVTAGDDGLPEFRLAVSLALQAAGFARDKTPYGPVRKHWIADKNQEAAAVMQGRSGLDDAIALVVRRLVEASQSGAHRLPLKAALRAAASMTDLAALVSGEVDLDRTLALARALMAVDGRQWALRPQTIQPPKERSWPDDAWLVIRLAMLPWPLPDGREIRVDPAIVRRLASGDAASALELALRRLQAAGIRPAVRMGAASEQTARLWAAALAFPINRQTAESMLRRLDTNSIQP